MKNTLININEDDFIAAGSFSKCYKHPNLPDQCIKIKTDHKKANKRLKADLAYYKKLHARQSDLHYIADYLGTCKTNLGQGYIYQCIVDEDGAVSKTLEHCLKNNILDPEIYLPELHRLATHLLNNRIIESDLHPRNILLQTAEGLAPKPVIVDGIGDKVSMPIENIFTSQVHAKIIRRWNKSINALMAKFPDYKHMMQGLYISKDNIEV